MGWRRAVVGVVVMVAGSVPAVVGAPAAHAAVGVTGVVHDSVGTPVAGVDVRTSYIAGGTWLATSGADGTFRFGSALSFPTGPFSVTALPPGGSGLGWETVDAVGVDGAFIDITLRAEATVNGTVRDADGAPLAGATVAFGAPPHAAFSVAYSCPPRAVSAISGADGRYTLRGLGLVRCPVWFDPPAGSGLAAELFVDTADVSKATPVQVSVPGTAVVGVDAQLERAGSITGRITDLTGAPAVEVFVSIQFPNGGLFSIIGPSAMTAPDGSFAITGLKPGPYDLTHFGGGVATRNTPLRIDVAAGATVALGTLALPRLPVVTIADLGVTQMAKGSRVNLRITGTNFAEGAVVDANVLEGGQVTVSNAMVVSSTLITAVIDLIPNPSWNRVTVYVNNPDDSGARCRDCIEIVEGPNLPQTVAFDPAPPVGVTSGATFVVGARATTGLDVPLHATGACTGAGSNRITVTTTGTGACTIEATQAGNAAFATAAAISATTTVSAPAVPSAAVPTVVTATPARLLDTRPDGPQRGYTGDKPAAGQTIEVQVAGAGGVPADAAAVVLNVTGTDATAAGFVTVWPCGEQRPLASSLNLTPGVTSPNAVITKLGVEGKVCLYTQSGTHLIADLAGWFPSGAGYTALRPDRLLDTRRDGPQRGYTGETPAAGQTVELAVTANGAVPADATTVVLNVTGTDATAAGFVTVWPCGEQRPLASSLNLTPGVTSPNAVITKLGVEGKVCLYTQSGTHLLADLTGYTI